ncbi:hypothetical protein IWQ61_005520 [Dispira simplex]|nr:hypothetical protein IWQ61_005520 [Dispira simplex]
MTAHPNAVKPVIPKHRVLPNKETTLFKTLLKEYEFKQYKKGLKVSDQILKKFPNHGETLCMKGLFLANLGRTEEGIVTVKLGITKDLTSHICWHVYGLIHRTNKNYAEAVKCYHQALKLDRGNFQILQDLAVLQTQLRQYDNLVQTRQSLLQLQPNNQSFWVRLCLAHQLTGKPEAALRVLTTFEETARMDPNKKDFEAGELLLYKNYLMELVGDYQKALDHLDSIRDQICDSLGWREKRADLLFKLERWSEAETAYRTLIDENADHQQYLWRWLQARKIVDPSLTPETLGQLQTGTLRDGVLDRELATRINEACRQLALVYPRSAQLQHIALRFTYDDEFRRQADSYLEVMFRKGVPSLFSSLKPLYTHQPDKIDLVYSIISHYRDTLRPATTPTSDTVDQSFSTYVWVLYFLALHYDYLGQSERALETIDKALQYSPTLVELRVAKAKFLKHLGDISSAATLLNTTRELDLKDRFINTKCDKYLLRDNQVTKAEDTVLLFVRRDVPSKIQELHEMQCIWYMLEAGYSYQRQRQWGPALKKYHFVQHIFGEYADDQLDFHTYCLRKFTLRSYLDLLTWEDRVYALPEYVDAALAAVECYLVLYDRSVRRPDLANTDSINQQNKPMPVPKETPQKKLKDTPGAGKITVDADPLGDKYVRSKDYLADALQLLKPLFDLKLQDDRVNLAALRIYNRQKQYLKAIDILNFLTARNGANPWMHPCLVHLQRAASSSDDLPEATQTAIAKVLRDHAPQLSNQEISLEAYLGEFVNEHHTSLPHLLAAADAVLPMPTEGQDVTPALELLSRPLTKEFTDRQLLSLTDFMTLYRAADTLHATVALDSFLKSDEPVAQRFISYASQHFPRASEFKQL